MHRRGVLKLIPAVVVGASALGPLVAFLEACKQEDPTPPRDNTKPTDNPDEGATDGDEYVPKTEDSPPPVIADVAPKVPNPPWESRAKQLVDEQQRVYAVGSFSTAAPGIFKGKERSHVPTVTQKTEGGLTKVTVLVEHVMGKNALNALDAGAADTGADARDTGPVDAGKLIDSGARVDTGAPVDSGPRSDAAVVAPPVHYITTMFLRAMVGGVDTIVGLWEFSSTDPAPPSVTFTLPAGVTAFTAWEWCTLHGLWTTESISVTP